MSIYAPIAARLGIYTYKGLLEDLSFKILSPRQYENLLTQLKDYQFKRGRSMDETKKELEDFLKENNISATVDGRIKNVYSIYKKLKLKNHTTISDIHDIFAIRVILPTKRTSRGDEAVDHLYGLLGLIHSKWRPIPNRFKDYVAVPKPNGYKSLHTAVLGLSIDSPNQSTEIQIRSQKMHEEAEYGVASHWLYEDMKKALTRYHKDRDLHHGSIIETAPARNYLQWIDALSSVQKELQEGKDFSDSMSLDVFSDRIFVLTPQGQVKDLPLGATPLDFAYSVHTDLGHRCVHARVNGVVVPLNYQLKNGEVVGIETNAKANPKLHWVSFVKTTSAKNKIRSFFRGLDSDRSFRDGRETVNKYLLKLKKPLLDDDLSLFRFYNGKRLSYKERVGLIEEIGNGSVLPAPVVRKALGQSEVRPIEVAEVATASSILLPKNQQKQRDSDTGLTISGETGVPYRFASCCKPTEADAIVAYVTRGNAVSVHRESCKVLRQADQARLIDANWGGHVEYHRFPVKVRLTAQDRIGLIRDIADVISSANINILDFGKEQRLEREIEREMILEVISQDQFQDVLQKLRRVRNIVGVQQTEGV
jgi:GTP pyrophosphokinase